MAQWRYAIDGQAYGPVSDEVIRSLAYQGVLGPMSTILVEGSSSWTPLYVHEAMLGLARTAQGNYAPLIPGTRASTWAAASGSSTEGTGPFGAPSHLGVRGALYATWWSRVLAAVIDFAVFELPLVLMLLAGNLIEHHAGPGDAEVLGGFTYTPAGFGLQVLGGLLYHGLLNGSVSGQTVGKRAMHLRTRSADGGPLGVRRGLGRAAAVLALRMLFVLPWIVSVLYPLWDPDRQSLHDKLVGSVVVDA
jgi:uncharacterized RDD family membrane protein YckC